MYVAMTRARKRLFISFFGMPSRFLSEIPQEYIRISEQIENTNVGDSDPLPDEDDYMNF
jgi:superfamily I DNA/RNA helicase